MMMEMILCISLLSRNYSLLLRLLVMLKKERHLSAQHSPSRTCELIQNSVSGFFSFRVCRCSCDEILTILRRVFVWVFDSLGF